MKKIFLFAFSATLFGYASTAQEGAKKKKDWGFKIGLNGSNLRMSEANADWKTGLVAGFFVKFKVNEKFSIQPEALYSSMGGKNLTNGTETSLRLNYFSLPVLAQYKVAKKLAIVAGPQIDVLIQAKTRNNSGSAKVTDSYREDSYNLTGGLACWPTHCLGFTLRYIYGLNDITEANSTNVKNQGVQLTAAVKL